MHRFGDFPHFWITLFCEFKHPSLERRDSLQDTGNKQNLQGPESPWKCPDSQVPPPWSLHQAAQGARGHSFKWCSGGISSGRVVYSCKQWHWFIKLDLNTVISWACHGYRYLGQINIDVCLLRKNQTTLRRSWHLSPIRWALQHWPVSSFSIKVTRTLTQDQKGGCQSDSRAPHFTVGEGAKPLTLVITVQLSLPY